MFQLPLIGVNGEKFSVTTSPVTKGIRVTSSRGVSEPIVRGV
jgi:hypothetical protein